MSQEQYQPRRLSRPGTMLMQRLLTPSRREGGQSSAPRQQRQTDIGVPNETPSKGVGVLGSSYTQEY
ncbi:hypothetical protein E4U43_004138 [Claviceps pusilla]|uniref:Uncharacterized protein n=1 Tax=Claviceps pusilla TaxID=123648 RepID=A0A9P7SU53_9HYPO|nr:hypothetical protein E4U43_004138 [Claviceps pusilla]